MDCTIAVACEINESVAGPLAALSAQQLD